MLDIIELTSGVNNVVYDIMLLMFNFYGTLRMRDLLYLLAKSLTLCSSKESYNAIISLSNPAFNGSVFLSL